MIEEQLGGTSLLHEGIQTYGFRFMEQQYRKRKSGDDQEAWNGEIKKQIEKRNDKRKWKERKCKKRKLIHFTGFTLRGRKVGKVSRTHCQFCTDFGGENLRNQIEYLFIYL